MLRAQYIFAGEPVSITSTHPYIHQMCADYIASDPKAEPTPDTICVLTTEEQIRREQVYSDEEMRHEGNPEVQYSDPYLETLAVYRQMCNELPARHVMLMHGSVIAVDGKAYMFTALSGTGKSTHTRLWREHFGARAVMINDDKPLIRVENGRAIVYGTPWDGKHRLSTNTSAPLAGIIILERGETNHIERISGEEAFPTLVQQSYRPDTMPGFVAVMDMLATIAENVPLYRLHCNMNPEAAIVSASGLGVQNV